MTSIAALTAAALLAGLSASPLVGLPEAAGDVTWRAGQVVWHGESGTYDLSGDVVVRRGGVVLRAQQATVDPATGEVWARGDVLLVDTTRAVAAETVHAVLDGPFEASAVTAFYKANPLEPVRIGSLADARRGRNQLTFRADRVEGDGAGRLRLQGSRFTPCDCGPAREPSWELDAPRAEVAGDRVYLHWPVLRIAPIGAVEPGHRRHVGYEDGLLDHPVPVFVVPWLSLPLTNRQSGILFPELGRNPTTGFHVALPIYVTLGRSADLTATPEYFFGSDTPHNPAGAVQGPGAKLELRWAPADRAFGQVLLHVVDDRDRERLYDPIPGRPQQRGGDGLRLSIEGVHAQDLGKDTRLGAHLSLVEDPFMFRDFHGMGLPGDAFYSRSDVLVSHRAEAWVIEGSAAYLEPLAAADKFRPHPSGRFEVGAPVLHRWPSASATLLPTWLGPVQADGRLGITRYAPLEGHRGELLRSDPGANPYFTPGDDNPYYFQAAHPGLAAPGDFSFSPRDGVFLDGQGQPHAIPREAVTRADLRLQLAAPMLLGRAVTFEPFVRGATLGYAFDARREPALAAWGVGGASVSAVLRRRYGELEHRIVPRLELVAGTSTWRPNAGGPLPAYDAFDRIDPQARAPVAGAPSPMPVAQKLSAAPVGDYTQLRASVQNRLAAGAAGAISLELGQDADLRRGKLAESFVSLSAAKGPFTADAGARAFLFGSRPPRAPGWFASWLDEFTRLHANATLHDARGDALRAGIDATGSGAVGALASGVDALFDLQSTGGPPDAWYRAGATVALGPAQVVYDVRLPARRLPAQVLGSCKNGRPVGEVPAGRAFQHDAVVVWDSPCHCFTVRLNASRDVCGDLSYGFSLDLSKIFQGGVPRPK